MAGTFFNSGNTPIDLIGRKRIEFRLFGQWEKTLNVVRNLSPAIKSSSLKAQLLVCNKIRDRVKKHLRDQDLGWRPLSQSYRRMKGDAGASTKILMSSGNYYKSIEVWQKGNQHFVFVGVRKGIYTQGASGRRSKLEISTIAAIHEFSSGRIVPKRPLWNPTIAEMGGAKGIKAMFVESLYKRLRNKGIPITILNKWL
jgi:hypothetical protein